MPAVAAGAVGEGRGGEERTQGKDYQPVTLALLCLGQSFDHRFQDSIKAGSTIRSV